MPEEDAIIEPLRAFEESLWRPETRQSGAWMERVLADDFVEVGASGRVWSRNEVLAPTSGSLDVELPLPEFSAVLLASDVALVTYLSVQRLAGGAQRRARRASVWRFGPTGWKLAYHQGTLAE